MSELNFCPVEREELLHDIKKMDQDDHVDWQAIESLAYELRAEFDNDPEFERFAGVVLLPWNHETFRHDLWIASLNRGTTPMQKFFNEFKSKWFEELAENIYSGYGD